MSQQTAPDLSGFSSKRQAAKRGRWTLAPATVTKIADGEVVGVGSHGSGDRIETALVYEHGAQQKDFPLHAAASGTVSGKTIPFPALVIAFEEAGTLPALKKAIAAREKEIADKAKALTT